MLDVEPREHGAITAAGQDEQDAGDHAADAPARPLMAEVDGQLGRARARDQVCWRPSGRRTASSVSRFTALRPASWRIIAMCAAGPPKVTTLSRRQTSGDLADERPSPEQVAIRSRLHPSGAGTCGNRPGWQDDRMPGTNLTRDEAATRAALLDVDIYDVTST